MPDPTVIGLPAEAGLAELKERGLAVSPVMTAAPARPGTDPAAAAQDRAPYIVRVSGGEAVCALFRVRDPAKENSQLE